MANKSIFEGGPSAWGNVTFSGGQGSVPTSASPSAKKPRKPRAAQRSPFEAMAQARQQMFTNLRSPTVRRTASGGIVDENRPEGLDWLKANNRTGGQSWETTAAPPPMPSQQELAAVGMQYGPGGELMPVPAGPKIAAGGGRAMMGQYGGGFSVPQGGDGGFNLQPSMRSPDFNPQSPSYVSTPQDAGSAGTGPFFNDEKALLAQNIQSAYNQTMTNPLTAEQPPAPLPPGQFNQAEQAYQNASQDFMSMPRSPFASSSSMGALPPEQNAQLWAQPQQQAPPAPSPMPNAPMPQQQAPAQPRSVFQQPQQQGTGATAMVVPGASRNRQAIIDFWKMLSPATF